MRPYYLITLVAAALVAVLVLALALAMPVRNVVLADWWRHHHHHPSSAPSTSPPPTTPATSSAPAASSAPPPTATSPAPPPSPPPRSPSPTPPPSTTGSSPAKPSWSPAGAWTPTFDDEFTGTGLDTSRWDTSWWDKGAAAGPANPQVETAAYASSHVSVSGGSLRLLLTGGPITAIAPNGSAVSYPHTGAMVYTRHIWTQAYGAFEARIYLPPAANGSVANWPAFWLTSTDVAEIDVMEGLGGGQASWHYHEYSPATYNTGGYQGSGWAGWHTYGVQWEPGVVRYYYDGRLVGTVTQGVSPGAMFMVFDYTTSGAYPGQVLTSAEMQVDWVRAWTG